MGNYNVKEKHRRSRKEGQGAIQLKYLPEVLLKEIQQFLPIKDSWKLLVTAKSIFAKTKDEVMKITINMNVRPQFFNELDYRRKVLKKITNSRMQLALILRQSWEDYSFLYDLPSYYLEISSCGSFSHSNERLMPFLSDHMTLILSGNHTLTHFHGLQNVNKLELHHFSVLTDLSKLTFLQELTLNNCSALDSVSCLSHLKKLTLRQCSKVVSVNGLGNISQLSIRKCSGLRDISALTNNHSLTILECPNIKKDFQPFTKPQYLETDLILNNFQLSEASCQNQFTGLILHNYSVSTIQLPTKVRRLSLYFSSLNNTSEDFQGLFYVKLYGCDGLKTLKGMSNIYYVEIRECSKLEDISGLGMNTVVILAGCHRITSFDSIMAVRRVSITFCEGFQNASHVMHVSYLTIENCSNLESVQILGKIGQRLELIYCSAIKTLKGLSFVPIIVIKDCHGIKSLEGLGDNDQIIISRIWSNMNYEQEKAKWLTGYTVFPQFDTDILFKS
jgi:hypothetical protein